MSIFSDSKSSTSLLALACLVALPAVGVGCDDDGPAPAADAGVPGLDAATADRSPDTGAGGSDGAAGDSTPGDGAAGDAAGSDGAEVGARPLFVPGPCDFMLPPALPLNARCGSVRVPEDRSRPDGRTVQLAVAVLSSRSASPAPATAVADPVVYLEGGPGGHAIATVTENAAAFLPVFLGGRELVTFDQRGTGRSTPRLDCPEIAQWSRAFLGKEGTPEADQALVQAHATCRTRLATGASLPHYNTASNADDVEAVRLALGYPTWNLLGVSYGTRLALEVMRRHPGGVRSVVLDSVAPPGLNWVAEMPRAFDRTVRELSAACDRDAECAKRYPGLAGKLIALARKLETTPLTLNLEGGKQAPFRGRDVLGIVRLLAYDGEAVGVVPQILIDLEAGRTSFPEILFNALLEGGEGIDIGMHEAVVCPEVMSVSARPATAAANAALDPLVKQAFDIAPYERVCTAWQLPPVADDQHRRVESALPTLLLSGHFDPATPPELAELAAGGLSQSTNLVIPDAAHGAFINRCGGSLLAAFWTNPASKPADPCTSRTPAVPFLFRPEGVPVARQHRDGHPELERRVQRLLERRRTRL